jgi:hypothetical protein
MRAKQMKLDIVHSLRNLLCNLSERLPQDHKSHSATPALRDSRTEVTICIAFLHERFDISPLCHLQ